MRKIILTFLLSSITALVLKSQELAVDTRPGSNGAGADDITLYGGKIYFTGSTSVGRELIIYDPTLGTNNITVVDINTFTGPDKSSSPERKIVYNNKLFFSAKPDQGQQNSLFSYNGTSLVNINNTIGNSNNRNISDLALVNGKLFFSASTTNSSSGTRFLYTYNDTASTPTISLININGQPNLISNFNPRNFAVVGNTIFFIAEHNTDGTRIFYYNTISGASGHLTNISSPAHLFPYGNAVFLNGITNTNVELLKIDVTNNNAVSVLQDNPSLFTSNNIVGHQNILYYKTSKGTSTNGLGAYDIDNDKFVYRYTVPNNAQVDNLVKYAGKIYFRAFFASGLDIQMAEYDPNLGYIKGLQIIPSSVNSGRDFKSGVVINGTLYFASITSNTTGAELHKFNGTVTVPTIDVDTDFLGGTGGTIGNNWSLASNWSNGVPTENTNAEIIGKTAFATDSNLKAKSITVNTAGKLELSQGASITISGNVNNFGSGIIDVKESSSIQINGNLTNGASTSNLQSINVLNNSVLNVQGNFNNFRETLVDSDATGSSSLIIGGNYDTGASSIHKLTYRRYITNNWHLIAPPTPANLGFFIGNNTFETGSVDTNHIGLAEYNNSISGGWDYYTNSTTGSFVAMRGYAIKKATSGTVDFVGSFRQASSLSIPLARGTNSNWNLVGNPYMSFIASNVSANSTNNLLTRNSTELDPSFVSLYFWDPSVGTNGEYIIINQMSSAHYITPGQGFFVNIKNGGGNFTFEESMQSHQTSNYFFKNSSVIPEIDITITSSSNSKKTSIKYLSTSTKGLDPGFDAGQFNGVENSNPINLYTQLVNNNQGINFALQVLPKDYENIVIPLGVDAPANTEIAFTINQNNLPNDLMVFIEDRTLNTITRLDTSNSEYRFTPSTTLSGTGRFYLHTSTKQVLSTDNLLLNSVSIYAVDNYIKINGLQGNKSIDFSIYNLVGQNILNAKLKTSTNMNVKLPLNITKGVYILQIKTEKGKINKKIILK